MTRTARIFAFGAAAALVLAGVAAAIGFSSTLGQVLAMVLIGLGLVVAVSLVFLEVGLSEDRERAREVRRKRPKEARPHPRLDRMRGRSRRLP